MTATVDLGVLTGSRKPRFRTVTEAGDVVDNLPDIMDLADEVGVVLDDWQCDVLRDWLVEREAAPGQFRFVHPAAALVVPRQSGKTLLACMRMLYALLVSGDRLVLYTSHRQATSLETFRALVDLVESSPSLLKRIRHIHRGVGREGIETVDGGRLRVLSRTANLGSAGRGFSPSLTILDEALALVDEHLSAILPAMSAQPNPQVLYLSSAGDASSQVLRRLVDRGREGGGVGFCYHEWSAPDGAPPGDPATWAVANPGLPVRPSLEAVQGEHATMSPRDFARERLGQWGTTAVTPALDPERLKTVFTADVGKPAPGRAIIAVEVSTDGEGERHAAIVVAWPGEDTTPRMVVTRSGPGVLWLPEALQEVMVTAATSVVVMSPGGATDVAAALRQAGIDLSEVRPGRWRGIAPAFADAVNSGNVTIQEDVHLLEAAALSPRKNYPDGAWCFNPAITVSIAPLVACAVALHGLTEWSNPAPAIW